MARRRKEAMVRAPRGRQSTNEGGWNMKWYEGGPINHGSVPEHLKVGRLLPNHDISPCSVARRRNRMPCEVTNASIKEESTFYDAEG